MSYKSEKILIENENMIVGQLENFEEASTLAMEPKDIINSNRMKKVCHKIFFPSLNFLKLILLKCF